MNVTDEMVEAGAIALRNARNMIGVGDPSYEWEATTPMARHAYRKEARAVLEAGAAHGQEQGR